MFTESVFVAEFLTTCISLSIRELSIKDLFWKPIVWLPTDMPSPLKLQLYDTSFNASGVCSLQDIVIGNSLIPFNMHDASQAAKVELFELIHIFPV